MREFAEKRRKHSLFYSMPVLIIALLVLFLIIKANWTMYSKVKESSERRDQIELELQDLNNRKQELEAEIKRLSSRVGIEEELRTRFDLLKENEEMIIILEEEKTQIEESAQKNQKTLFQKIKGWFE